MPTRAVDNLSAGNALASESLGWPSLAQGFPFCHFGALAPRWQFSCPDGRLALTRSGGNGLRGEPSPPLWRCSLPRTKGPTVQVGRTRVACAPASQTSSDFACAATPLGTCTGGEKRLRLALCGRSPLARGVPPRRAREALRTHLPQPWGFASPSLVEFRDTNNFQNAHETVGGNV